MENEAKAAADKAAQEATAKAAADKAAADELEKLEKEKADAEAKEAAKIAKKVKAKELTGKDEFLIYQQFAELKFLQWNDGKFEKKNLKPSALKDFEALEKKVKEFKTKLIPNKSKTIWGGIGEKNIKIVEGHAVPKYLFDMLTGAQQGIYFS